jgi:hypothetical protein
MKFEAIVADNRLICSDSHVINSNPNILLTQVHTSDGIYAVQGDVDCEGVITEITSKIEMDDMTIDLVVAMLGLSE